MKNFCLFIFFLLITMRLFSQRSISGQHMTAPLKATIRVSDIHPTPATYKPRFKKKSHNEEEEEEGELRRKKIRPPRVEYPVPAETIQPTRQMITDSRSGSTLINESPCVGYRGLYASGTTIPPDVSAAVGFDHIFMALNDSFRLQNKD